MSTSYYFKRTPLCDELSLFNSNKSVTIEGVRWDLDIKTISSPKASGDPSTPMVIVCAPSTDKRWMNSPWETPIRPIPDEIAQWLHENRTFGNPRKITIEDKPEYGDVSIEKVASLLELMDGERFNHRDEWLRICGAIKDACDTEEGFELFDKNSQRTSANNYSRRACRKLWDSLAAGGGCTAGTLHYYAKLDSPEDYYERFIQKAPAAPAFREDSEALMGDIWEYKPGPKDEYQMIKPHFEKYNFKITQDGTFGRTNRANNVVSFMKESQLRAIYRDWKCVCPELVGTKIMYYKVSFIETWLDDITKRAYERVNFAPPPAAVPSYIFNTFYGFAGSKITAEASTDMEPILGLIRLVSGCNDACYEYFLDWMACCVQKPADKSDATSIFISGEQGIGKTLFVEWFGRHIIGGAYYKKPENLEDQVFGRFADCIENTTLMYFDESHGLQKYNDRLKGMITSDTFIKAFSLVK